MEKEENNCVLQFNEQEGKFCVVNHVNELYIKTLDFGAKFQVLENGKWVDSELVIDSNDKGEMIFALKNTGYKGILDGIPVRLTLKNSH